MIQAHIFNVQAIRQKACQHFTSGCKNYSRKSSHSKDADYVPLTFIRIFKQYEGMTPGQYKDLSQNRKSEM